MRFDLKIFRKKRSSYLGKLKRILREGRVNREEIQLKQEIFENAGSPERRGVKPLYKTD